MMHKWYYLVIVLEEVFVFEHYIVSTALLWVKKFVLLFFFSFF